jgi:hypothetical protein
MRTADNTSGSSCVNATSNTHLGPVPSSSSGPEERLASTTTEVTAKPQSLPCPSKPVSEDVTTSKEQLPFNGYALSILSMPFSSFVVPEISIISYYIKLYYIKNIHLQVKGGLV